MKRLAWKMLLLVGITLAAAGCRQALKPSNTNTKASTLRTAPDFSLPGVNGKAVALHDFKGKVILIDFWATWCPPCRKEIPHLVSFYDQYKEKGFVLIGLSLDEGGMKDVKPFVKEFKMDYPVAIANQDVQNAYGPLVGTPTKVIINKEGEIVDTLIGYQDISALENKIMPLLKL